MAVLSSMTAASSFFYILNFNLLYVYIYIYIYIYILTFDVYYIPKNRYRIRNSHNYYYWKFTDQYSAKHRSV